MILPQYKSISPILFTTSSNGTRNIFQIISRMSEFRFIQLSMRFYIVLNCISTDNAKITKKIRQLDFSGFRSSFFFSQSSSCLLILYLDSASHDSSHMTNRTRVTFLLFLNIRIWIDNCHRY